MILTPQYMSSLSANIYFRWEVIIIQHPDSYFRHIEVSEKIGLQKSPHRLMGGTGGPWTICIHFELLKAIGQLLMEILHFYYMYLGDTRVVWPRAQLF